MSDLALAATSFEHDRSYRVGLVGGELFVLAARTWLTLVAGLIAWSVLPMLLGWHPVLVTGGSMSPRIQPGDVVLADPGLAPKQGRIMVMHGTRADGQHVMHRVVSVNPDGTLTTKGDANAANDTTAVPLQDVDGGVRLIIPGAGRLALGLLAVRDRLSAGHSATSQTSHRTPFSRTDGIWLTGTLLALLLAAPRGRRKNSTSPNGDDVLDDRVAQ